MIFAFSIGVLLLILQLSGFLAENSVTIWSADAYIFYAVLNNLRSYPNLVHIAIMRVEECFRYKELGKHFL